MDYEKELAEFSFAGVDHNLLRQTDEGALLISNFSATLKRLGIDQARTNMTMEDLADTLEEIREQNRMADEYQARAAEKTEAYDRLVRVVIAVMDPIEDLCRYFKGRPEDTHHRQIALMWQQMCGSLAAADLNVIGTDQVL